MAFAIQNNFVIVGVSEGKAAALIKQQHLALL